MSGEETKADLVPIWTLQRLVGRTSEGERLWSETEGTLYSEQDAFEEARRMSWSNGRTYRVIRHVRSLVCEVRP